MQLLIRYAFHEALRAEYFNIIVIMYSFNFILTAFNYLILYYDLIQNDLLGFIDYDFSFTRPLLWFN